MGLKELQCLSAIVIRDEQPTTLEDFLGEKSSESACSMSGL